MMGRPARVTSARTMLHHDQATNIVTAMLTAQVERALEMEARAKAAAVTVCTTVGPSAITPPARRTPSARLAVVLEMGADCSPRWAQGVQVHAIIKTPPALRLSLATKMLIAVLTAALATVAVSCPR